MVTKFHNNTIQFLYNIPFQYLNFHIIKIYKYFTQHETMRHACKSTCCNNVRANHCGFYRSAKTEKIHQRKWIRQEFVGVLNVEKSSPDRGGDTSAEEVKKTGGPMEIEAIKGAARGWHSGRWKRYVAEILIVTVRDRNFRRGFAS